MGKNINNTTNAIISTKDKVLSIVVRILLGISVGCILIGAIASVVSTVGNINIIMAMQFNMIGIGFYILSVVVSELADDLR